MSRLRRLDIFRLPYRRQHRYPNRKMTVPPIYGLDIETRNGYAKLMASSEGNYREVTSFDDAIEFMSRHRLRGTLNLFWNINYDLMSVLKYLGRNYLEALYYLGKTRYKDVKLRWIPHKWFCIKKHKHTYNYFDLMQFYGMKLDKAAKDYLGERKIEIEVKKFDDLEYWNANLDKIAQYCMRDADLTARLGNLMGSKAKEVGIPFQRPFSKGYLAGRFFITNCQCPKIRRAEWHQYALRSYYGGRFEVTRKGRFAKSFQYDINSAYPHQIAQLPDFTKGHWVNSKGIPTEAEVGFLKCSVSVDSDFVAPFPYDRKGLIVFPNYEDRHFYLTLKEYLYFEHQKQADIEFTDGWFFIPDTDNRPFAIMHELYEKKSAYKDVDDTFYNLIKIVMNAFYGKHLEVIGVLRPTADPTEAVISIDAPYEKYDLYKPELRIGNLFYPVIGALTTAWTRLELYRIMERYKKHLIAAFTDCVFLDRPAALNSKQMGGWALDKQGDLLMIQSGVYSIQTDEGLHTKCRGFKIRKGESLFELFEEHKDASKVEKYFVKVQGLGESLAHRHKLQFIDLNVFREFKRTIDINGDRKRIWEREATDCADLLDNQIASEPLTITI